MTFPSTTICCARSAQTHAHGHPLDQVGEQGRLPLGLAAGQDPEHPGGDPALGVDDQGVGRGLGPEGAEPGREHGRPVEQRRVADLELLQIGGGRALVVTDVDADHAHVLAGQGLAGQLEALLLGPAGPAPGRPEVEHQGVAAQAGQVDPLVVEGPAGEGGQGLALALGHDGHARGDLLHLAGAGLGDQARPTGAGQGDHGDHGRRHDHGHHGNGCAARHGDLGFST